MPGRLFVISGPSGTGKTTVVRGLRERVDGLGFSVSHTTREPREGEEEGVHYHFVDQETFQRMIDEGAFVEWAVVYNHYYGTSYAALREPMEKGIDVVLDIDSQGAANVRKLFKESILIYLLPPSLEELENRLKKRATDSGPVIEARFKKGVADIKNCSWYDYIVFNDSLEQAVEELASIIIAERCRTSAQMPRIKEMIQIASRD
ncbi:MAG: guanylate kinase [Deltaproteobacteria bacterium]|nr:guanylate kinase [Deltaproteobacteria bacterium]MBW2015914.1 guanylate kinase [Deltaproteobacteria bacterium]MBW2303623.1 guanylate kinase [Deltaproteobacteria bacterium]